MTQGEGQAFCAGELRDGDCYPLLEEFAMAELETYPYETRLNILHRPLELIDVHAVPGADDYKWFNQTLCKVNESVVRMAAIEGEYHWHKHDEDDEFFYVVDGELLIDIRDESNGAFADRTVSLQP